MMLALAGLPIATGAEPLAGAPAATGVATLPLRVVVGKTGAEYPYSCACGRLKPTVSRHLVEPFSETLINALEARAVAESLKLPWHLKGKNRLAIRVILEDILGRKVQH